MNIEFLRSPWFMLAVVFLAGGAFMASVLGWGIAGWGSILLGLGLVVFARYRQGV
ncbi:hypothetical protein ACQ3I4_07905 [Zafaria sp. Z1313]|uniref:hypothetical protein n=1 Tax=unclassified Zafaria TaxID=2828765 RepID=UPI002E788B51|nr:hypothetical protein [Zafaria sp. J156]MEE1621074.1 hypothetical protein [Zafaria sp. J156]